MDRRGVPQLVLQRGRAQAARKESARSQWGRERALKHSDFDESTHCRHCTRRRTGKLIELGSAREPWGATVRRGRAGQVRDELPKVHGPQQVEAGWQGPTAQGAVRQCRES